MSADFYADLPVLEDFGAVTRTEAFVPLPGDWHVATCDVRNSTRAVEAGNYKHVNTVGAHGGLFLAAKEFKERAAKLC